MMGTLYFSLLEISELKWFLKYHIPGDEIQENIVLLI